jgi:hypothetical protein
MKWSNTELEGPGRKYRVYMTPCPTHPPTVATQGTCHFTAGKWWNGRPGCIVPLLCVDTFSIQVIINKYDFTALCRPLTAFSVS